MAGNSTFAKEPAPRPVGRPRRMEAQQVILAAAADLLESQPYRDISVERVAAQAGVGKQTLYRWYENKAELMLDAFLARHAQAMPPAPAGNDALADLRHYLHEVVAVLAHPPVAGGYRALFAEAQFSRKFRERFGEIVLKRPREVARSLVLAALEQGALRPGADPDVLVDAVFAPVLMRFFGTVDLSGEVDADRIVDLVLRGARAA